MPVAVLDRTFHPLMSRAPELAMDGQKMNGQFLRRNEKRRASLRPRERPMSQGNQASCDAHTTHTITLDCPIDCLSAVLSGMAFNPLARAYRARFDPPTTVGDVVKLHRERRLGDIWGLGQRRIGEIEASLVLAGFVTGEHIPST